MNDIDLIRSARPTIESLDATSKDRLYATIADSYKRGPGNTAESTVPPADDIPLVTIAPHRHSRSHGRSLVIVATAACALAAGVVAGVRHDSDRTSPQAPNTATTPTTATIPATAVPVSSTTATSESTIPPTTTATSALRYVPGAPVWPYELVATSQDWERLVIRGIEAVTRTCMATHGFDYTPMPQDQPNIAAPDIKDAEYRSKYGYGEPPRQYDAAASDAYMNQDKQPGFHSALYGGDPNAQMGGCQKVAYTTIYAPEGIAVSPDNDAYLRSATAWLVANGVSDNPKGRDPFAAPKITNPVLASAVSDWSTCMAAKAVTANTPTQLAGMETQRPASAPKQATTDEITVALKDWNCQQSTGYLDRWYGTLQTLTAQFATKNADLVDRIHHWQDEVAARSTTAINASP